MSAAIATIWASVTTVLVGGRTALTSTVLYASQEIRDAVINSGMEHVAEGYNTLAKYLASIA